MENIPINPEQNCNGVPYCILQFFLNLPISPIDIYICQICDILYVCTGSALAILLMLIFCKICIHYSRPLLMRCCVPDISTARKGVDGSGLEDFDEGGGASKQKEFLSNYILDAFPSNALLAISKNGEEISVLKLILYSLNY